MCASNVRTLLPTLPPHLGLSVDSNEENALGRRMLVHYIALGLLGMQKAFGRSILFLVQLNVTKQIYGC